MSPSKSITRSRKRLSGVALSVSLVRLSIWPPSKWEPWKPSQKRKLRTPQDSRRKWKSCRNSTIQMSSNSTSTSKIKRMCIWSAKCARVVSYSTTLLLRSALMKTMQPLSSKRSCRLSSTAIPTTSLTEISSQKTSSMCPNHLRTTNFPMTSRSSILVFQKFAMIEILERLRGWRLGLVRLIISLQRSWRETTTSHAISGRQDASYTFSFADILHSLAMMTKTFSELCKRVNSPLMKRNGAKFRKRLKIWLKRWFLSRKDDWVPRKFSIMPGSKIMSISRTKLNSKREILRHLSSSWRAKNSNKQPWQLSQYMQAQMTSSSWLNVSKLSTKMETEPLLSKKWRLDSVTKKTPIHSWPYLREQTLITPVPSITPSFWLQPSISRPSWGMIILRLRSTCLTKMAAARSQ